MANGILKKILDIQQNLVVQKTGYDDRNDYYYYKAEDVATAVRQAMNEHKVIHRVEVVEVVDGNRVDAQGRERARITITYNVIFVDAEDGSEWTVQVVGTGSDIGGDKHTRKAAVQAFKIAAVELFIITEEHEKFDSDGAAEAEPEAVGTAAPAEKALTIKELNARVGQLVKDESNPIDGKIVGQVGNFFAEKHGIEQKSVTWKKETKVMEPLVKALEDALESLKDGSAGDIQAAVKLSTTGEVD